MTTDSLTNLVANLGTARDKMSSSRITVPYLTPVDLVSAYRGSWMARKGIDIPALDACREWRDWMAETSDITKIEAEENRLQIRSKVLLAKTAARLYGGAALIIGTGDTDPSQPLNPERIKAGGIKYVHVVFRRQLSAGDKDRDINSDYFGQPAYWSLSTDGKQSPLIHPSRIVFFQGAQVPDGEISGMEPGWGDSVLTSVLSDVLAFASVAANISSLTFEAKVDTVGIPDLMSKLNEPNYTSLMLRRLGLAETGKGINGTLIHDAEETLGQKTASFASLPDLIDRYAQITCGAFDIPATRFMSMSAGGLNSTGEGDLRNYYDKVSSGQNLEMTPAMHIMDECLIRSALGVRPNDVHYLWASLWQISDKERSEIGKTQTDSIKVLRDTTLIPDEVLQQTAVNILTESGAMPGLEGFMAEWVKDNPQEGEGDDDAIAPPVKPNAEAEEEDPEADPEAKADAAPRSLYVSRKVINADEILRWASEQGLSDLVDPEDLHVTIAHSKMAVDWMKAGEAWEDKLELAAGGPRLTLQFGKWTVLAFVSSSLKWRHEALKEIGAMWEYPEYQPHISISKTGEGFDPESIKPYTGKIVLGPEIFEEVKDDA